MQEETLTFATPSDLAPIKELMLNALQKDPKAFSVSYEEYSQKTEDWWQNYCFSFLYSIKGKLVLAWEKEKPIGMVGVLYSNQERRSHVASIVWMFVLDSYRGKHIGTKLLHKLEEEIKREKGIKKIILSVTSSQETAVKLYKKDGFEVVGKLTQEFNIDNELVDEIIMEKIL